MNPVIGWALALAALMAGYVGYGWPGVALAVSVVVFWLLMQFSRALRAMRNAAGKPVGHVDSAVMLHARLRTGMRMMDVINLTRSLGRKVADHPESYTWTDASGALVRLEFDAGRCRSWVLERPPG